MTRNDNIPPHTPLPQRTGSVHSGSKTRVVIVGAGFAGLEAAKHLGKAGLDVTIIDRHNHHLFQPLLYQVATAALSAPEIAEPVRKILRRYKSVHVVYGEVVDIRVQDRRVELRDGSSISYDHLVLATGARTGYFGNEEWARAAPGLKTIEDARRIRSKLLLSFERAERVVDPVARQRLMTIAIIGGGPTGVELAGAIAELSRYTLARDFRQIRPASTRILLLEGGPRLLSGFSEKLSDYARRRLEWLGVSVKTGKMVSAIDKSGVEYGGQRISTGLVIWAAGVTASELGRKLGVPTDRSGRVMVEPTLAVSGCPNVYVMGDLANLADESGNPLPGLAQVAKQQGAHLGRALAALISDATPLPPFIYRSRGNTAIVGRHAAVFEAGRLRIKGWFAWISWAIIHVYLLVGFQHRVTVSIQWLWRYLSYERGARLIAGDHDEETAGARPTSGRPEVEHQEAAPRSSPDA